jgi:hypothetical protein
VGELAQALSYLSLSAFTAVEQSTILYDMTRQGKLQRFCDSRSLLVMSGEAWYIPHLYTEETRTAIPLSLSRLNHRLPGREAHPKVMERTADLHHQIANTLLPQADAVFE